MVTDALTIAASWGLVAGIYYTFDPSPDAFYYIFSRWGFGLIYLALNVVARLYHGNPLYPGMALAPVEEFRRLILTTLGTGILFFAYLSFYGKSSPVPIWVVLVTMVLNMLLAQPMRNVLRRLLQRMKVAQIPCVLVGPEQETDYLRGILDHSSHSGLSVRATFLRTDEACDFARHHDIKHGISCQPLRVFRAAIGQFLGWFSVLVSLPEPRVFPIAMMHPVEFGGYGGLEFANQLRQKGVRGAKHLTEVVLALIAGAFCLVPGLVIMAILWVTLGRKGIFYKAQRVGRRGRMFTMWKFRTMCMDADQKLAEILATDPERAKEWEATQKFKDDPRVTKFGAFLRKTSLDELPQLLNVLRGEMALIGPRPITQREVARYADYYGFVSMVKPGVTGLWQVSGRSESDYTSRVVLDLYYAQNWNLWLDLWIFARTFHVVLLQRGAY